MAKAPYHATLALGAIADRMISRLENNQAARAMQAEVNRLRSGAEALDSVRRARNPVDTPEGHALKVGRLAQKYDREVTAAINRAGEHYRAGLADAERRIAAKVDLRPDAFAAEIRSAFRALDRKGKLELLGQLVRENRGPELAAIVKAPAILTGIAEDERANYERAIIGQHASEEAAEIESLSEVMDAVTTATRTASNMASAFRDPAKMAEIERAEAAAKAAGEAFDQSLQ